MTAPQVSLWSVRYHPARAFLLLRGLYLLLAADIWLGMIQHGGRYGIGGFNVAHFALLDRLVPLPTPTLYVGLLIAAGTLSLQLALDPASRWLRLVLAGAYTFGWLISIHDSYQHHYFLSWLLFWAAALPSPSAATLAEGTPVRGWGLPMTAVSCAIVYTFTGISKSEAEWRSGQVLRTLTHTRPPGDPNPGKFDGLRDLLMSAGLDERSVWLLLVYATIALQWVIALGYVAAPRRDTQASAWRTAVVTLGLLGALSFHAVTELFEVFEIGLFSYYMIWIALVVLGPSWLVATPASELARAGERFIAHLSSSERGERAALWGSFAGAALLIAVGFIIPLPGAVWASVCVALLVVVRAVATRASASLRPLCVSSCLSALALWAALTKTSVPFDYYRRAAGELQRMGRLEQSLAMYRLAEAHAPAGRSRRDRIRQLEKLLEREQQTPQPPPSDR